MSPEFKLCTISLVAQLAACAPAAEAPRPPGLHAAPPLVQPEAPAAASVAPETTREPIILVTERAALRAVEARGHALGARLGAAAPNGAPAAPLSAIVKVIEDEVASIRRADPQSGAGVGDKPHRLFDVRILRSPDARFELAGVVNRIDRAAFAPGGCGEVRLVYRLSYVKSTPSGPVASRLPATVGLEYLVPRDQESASPVSSPPLQADSGCRAAAERWRAPAGLSGEALAAWLTSAEGPLSAARLAGYALGAVNVNVQTVRWPSTVRPDLGGHAEYLLRSFRVDPAAGLVPKPLENTPDVARIRREPELRRALLAWMSAEESLAAIDRGAPVLPEKLLAVRAVSVSPRGLARRANRPFRQLFDPRELAGLDLASRGTIRSPAALLRRLDELSCQGCHQTRSVAGFHLLGEEEPDNRGANALAVPVSPHVVAEAARRLAVTDALARGEPADLAAPFAERAPGASGRGAHCGLGDPGFAEWTCAPGLSCVEDDTASDAIEVGVCMPEGGGEAGDPCEIARVSADEGGRRDRVAKVTRRACAAPGVCDTNDVGFPGGMCATTCAAAEAGGRGVCGRIPVLIGFNDCLARKVPFEQCIADNARPAGLAACDAASPCRDDYVCARTAAGAGACMPPYFLFQLRVDGHPPGGP